MRSFVLGTKRPSIRRFARNRVLRIVPIFYVIAALVLLRFGLDGVDRPDAGQPVRRRRRLDAGGRSCRSSRSPRATPAARRRCRSARRGRWTSRSRSTPRSRSRRVIAYRLGKPLKTPARARDRGARVHRRPRALQHRPAPVRQQQLRRRSTSPPLIIYVFLPGVALAVARAVRGPVVSRPPAARAPLRLGAASASRRSPALLYMQLGLRGRHDADPPRARPPLPCSSRSSAWRSSAAMIALQLGTDRAPRWLNNRATNWIGERSYAFYLLHVWVLFEIIHVVGARDRPGAARRRCMLVVGLPDLRRPGGAVVAATSSGRASSGACRGRPACGRAQDKAHEVRRPEARARARAREGAGRERASAPPPAPRASAPSARASQLWARRLDAALRRAGGRLVLDAPHGAHFYELPRLEIHPYGHGDGDADAPPRRSTRMLGRGRSSRSGRARDEHRSSSATAPRSAPACASSCAAAPCASATTRRSATTACSTCMAAARSCSATRVQFGAQVCAARDRARSQLGDHVTVGERTSMFDSDHRHDGSDAPVVDQPVAVTPIEIGSNTFIGANSLVLRGAPRRAELHVRRRERRARRRATRRLPLRRLAAAAVRPLQPHAPARPANP